MERDGIGRRDSGDSVGVGVVESYSAGGRDSATCYCVAGGDQTRYCSGAGQYSAEASHVE